MTERQPVLVLPDLVLPEVSTVDATKLGAQLVNHRQLFLSFVKELVADRDREKLETFVQGRCAVHGMLGAQGTYQRVSGLAGAPFDPFDHYVVHSGRAIAALGLALVDEPDAASGHVETFRRWLDCSGLRVHEAPVRLLGTGIGTRHRAVLEHLVSREELDLLTLTWLLELGGELRAPKEKPQVRTGPGVQVLLDLGTRGQRAELRLSSSRDLPPGLVPDPAMMTLTSADPMFQEALATAWKLAGGSLDHAVLWSLTDSAGPVLRVGGPSLGAALTVLLNEHSRISRRVRGPLTAFRVRSENAIVGAVHEDTPKAVLPVSGYEAKLRAITDSMRVILPSANLGEAKEADRSGLAELKPVDTWPEAAKSARRWARRRTLTVAASLLGVLTLVAGTITWITASGREDDQRRAQSSSLAAQAVNLRDTDPPLAAKKALAAHRIDPANPSAVDALRDLLADRRNVARSWSAHPSRVDALAVSEDLGRIVTSGGDELTKVWKTDGTWLGQVPRHSIRLVTAESQGLAAGVTVTGLSLFDIGGDAPTELAQLPRPGCVSKYVDDVADLAFTGQDSTLVTVWRDGAVSVHDVVTHKEISCTAPAEALSPLRFNPELPTEKVLDADVVELQPSGQLEIVLLLTSNDVVTVRRPGTTAEITLPFRQITDTPTSVAASPTAIAVGTKRGVVVWSKPGLTLLMNPAGGLNTEPATIEFSDGHLLLGGDAGAAVVRVGNPSWRMPDSLGDLNGGAARVAAIDERTVVTGGRDGEVRVIGDTAGLRVDQLTFATDVDFLPDGRLVGSSVPSSNGVDPTTFNTYSDSLVLLDPKRAPDPVESKGNIDTHYIYGSERTKFFANEVAAIPGLAAAAGQISGAGAILVWRDDRKDSPRLLSIPDIESKGSDLPARIIGSVGITPDGATLVARHANGKLAVFSTEKWKITSTLDFKPGPVRLSVGPKHVLLISGVDQNAELVRIELPSGAVTHREAAPNTRYLTASADGATVITMTKDGQLQRRDAELKPVGSSWRPSSSGAQVLAVTSDPSGRRVAIGQGEKVLVYDIETRLLAFPELVAAKGNVVNLSWSLDSQMLTAVSMPPQRGLIQVSPLRLWRVGDLDWTDQVCRWTGTGFTTDEWIRHVGKDIPYIDLCGRDS